MNTDPNSKSCMKEEVALDCLVKAYEHRAARMVRVAFNKLQNLLQSGKPQEVAWNMSSVQLTWASKAHCHAYVVKTFAEVVSDPSVDNGIRGVLTALCKLYGVCGIIDNLGEFIQDGFFNSTQVNFINKKMLSLLAEIRPNAVALVDAYDIPDRVLDSCLGRYDGQAYQALYEYAKASPLNKTDVHPAYYKYLRPLITQGLDKLQIPARL